MKPVNLTETESAVIGTKFGYVPPKAWDEDSGICWRYLDRDVSKEDALVLEALQEKRLVCHMEAKRWSALVDEDCWVLTEAGMGIHGWFHSFPENYGL